MKRAIWASYSFFIFANLLDILSSIGQFEANPLMQQSIFFPMFSLKKALFIKGMFLVYYALLGIWAYCIISPFSRRVAYAVVSIIPMQTTYLLIQVAFHNLLG